MNKRMKQFLTGLCFALLLAASGVLLAPAPVQAVESGSWDQVCCGSMCQGGVDYCLGNGNRTCCKD